MKPKLLKFLKYIPACLFAICTVWSLTQNKGMLTLFWFLMWFISWVPFQFPKEAYIKACDQHFEVLLEQKLLQSIPYSEIGLISLTTETQNIRSPKFGTGWRDAALVSLHSPDSVFPQNMSWWSSMKRNYGCHDNVYISIPFSASELCFLMKKTVCNLYITEQVYKMYEQDIYPLEHPFGKRIYICFRQGNTSAMTSLHNYRQHILK